MIKKMLVFAIAALFWLTLVPFASAEEWAVIKDSSGKCSVRSVKKATPKTIAGPFKSKAEAEKAKQEKCPKPEKKSKK